MIKAKNLYLRSNNIKKIPCSENKLMYNILMNNHMIININGLFVETLDPNSEIAKYLTNNTSKSNVV